MRPPLVGIHAGGGLHVHLVIYLALCYQPKEKQKGNIAIEMQIGTGFVNMPVLLKIAAFKARYSVQYIYMYMQGQQRGHPYFIFITRDGRFLVPK